MPSQPKQVSLNADGVAVFSPKEWRVGALFQESGREKPVVRKALGMAYLRNSEFVKAAPHLRAAMKIQPNDAETRRELIRAFDESGDAKAAREQLLASIRLAPRELGLIADLGRRFQMAENSAAAERAFTGLVEVMPNEAEGHQKLAEVRVEQERWDEAIEHWKRVSHFRSLEPIGELGLVTTYLAANRKAAAGNTFARLMEKKWPSRFDEAIRKVRQQLPERRGP
jgi:tetratricopeptide (TPR) repeat protein